MTRSVQMSIFIGVFAAVLALSHYYLYARVSYYFHLAGSARRLAGFLIGGLGLLALLALPLTRQLPRSIAGPIDWVAFTWMGFALLMFVVVVATDIAWLINVAAAPAEPDPTRRYVLRQIFGFAALGITGALGGYSLWNGMRPAGVKPLTVNLARLPQAMDGFRVVQITDLHIGPLIEGPFLRQVVDKVNALKPDLIAITGDLVDGSVAELASQVAALADLKAPQGVYFITGNHEYYSGVEPWCRHIASLGIRVLRNERVAINGNDGFDLAGVDDWGARRFPGEGPDLPKALAGRDAAKPLILLAHQPAAIDEASLHGVDLQLSGHTHGGQIWPFRYLVYLQQPYVQGLHRHRDTQTQIYVSPGTGYWGPPMRFGTVAEITHITLRASA